MHPNLYYHLKGSGSSYIDKSLFKDTEELVPDIHDEEIGILNRMAKHFPPGSASELLAVTHWEKGAWSKKYKPGMKNTIISVDDILEEYKKR